MSVAQSLVFLVFAVYWTRVCAAVDLHKPCFEGECAYALPQSSGTSGLFVLLADPKAITDITPAAGWIILDCDPNTLEQDIRLICEGDYEDSGCQNIFDHHGAHNKFVRLPDGCGSGPFARLAQMTVADDQSIPLHAHSRVNRRGRVLPTVHVMKVDAEFTAMDHSITGDVNFAFFGLNQPNIDVNRLLDDGELRDMRESFDRSKYPPGPDVVTSDGGARDEEGILDKLSRKSKDITDLIKNKTSFKLEPTIESTNVSLTKDISLVHDKNLPSCNGISVKAIAMVNSKGWAKAHVGLVLSGSVFPLPDIKELGTFGGLLGTVDAKVNMELLINGAIHLERKLIDDVGIPGWEIHGLIKIGPYVSVTAKAEAALALSLNVDLSLAYDFDLEFWYPNSLASKFPKAVKGLKNKKSDLNFNVTSGVAAKGFIQVTLTPQVNVGIKILDKTISGAAYLAADAWVRVIVQASASVSSKKAEYDLCFWLDAGLRLRAGAEGNFLGWNKMKEIDIWESPNTWNLFTKCWPNGKTSSKPSFPNLAKSKGDSSCPSGKSATQSRIGQVQAKTLA